MNECMNEWMKKGNKSPFATTIKYAKINPYFQNVCKVPVYKKTKNSVAL